jgi:hypothetical protein
LATSSKIQTRGDNLDLARDQPLTERAFEAAGLAAGMEVLDLGLSGRKVG